MTWEEVRNEAEEHSDRNIYLVGETFPLPEEELENVKNIFRTMNHEFLDFFKKRTEGIVSVAVHVRRTDFIPLGCGNEYAYYDAAIHYVIQRIPNAEFFFFSDDIANVKESLGVADNYHYVNLPGGFTTDIVEMLCMSVCNHRIMTERSGYSKWAARLNTDEAAMNLVFSEEETGHHIRNCINISKQMVEDYFLNKEEKNQNSEGKRVVKEILETLLCDDTDVDDAMCKLCEICFDCGELTKEEKSLLYLCYESLLIQKEDFIAAEQAVLKHLEFAPDSVEANCNMAVVKKVLGKDMAAYMFASRVCWESLDEAYMKFFFDSFSEDEAFDYFKKLCTIPRMHFILCPVSPAHFYVKQSMSMAIILKQLGHEVSVLSANPMRGNFPAGWMENDIVRYLMNSVGEIDLSYQHHVKIYPFLEVKDMKIYLALIDALAKSTTLPSVIVGRSFRAVYSAEKYPMIYWDFSEKKDLDSLLFRGIENWEKPDVVMRERAKYILTTERKGWERYNAKMKIEEHYLEQTPYWFSEEPCFGVNYFETESFLKFAFDLTELASQVV